MLSWEILVRERIGEFGVPPGQREEIVAELAAHMEDLYEEGRERGLAESEAVAQALEQVMDWQSLARRIRRVKRDEGVVNARTRQLWLPSLVSLTLANALLMVMAKLSLEPRMIVSYSMSWYPGGALMLAYLQWLAAQPLTGAAGAYLSYRAGGDRLARLLAGLFPSIVMLGLWCVLIPVSEIVTRHAFVMRHPVYFAVGAMGWVLCPGMALLFGAMPFVAAPKIQES
ncbi:MAG: hypothetical protein ABSG41_28085 [Bryobacteraceae bacterium]|jgi:hypothetical protein